MVFKYWKRSERLYIVGDFNASIGKDRAPLYPHIGKYLLYSEKTNHNGNQLIDFCIRNNLCNPQSFIQQEKKFKITFLPPRHFEESNRIKRMESSKQINYIIV